MLLPRRFSILAIEERPWAHPRRAVPQPLKWIVLRALIEQMQDKDPVKSQRVLKTMLQMTKIDIEA